MEKKKASLKDVMKKDDTMTFEKAQELKDKAKVADSPKVGRKMLGKSKATNKITFYVDDEQYAILKAKLDYDKKLSTPNAVAKHLLVKILDEIEPI
jgi:hypothetical protein